jgi:hypothetical protein
MLVLIGVFSIGCAGEPAPSLPDPEESRQSILTANDAMVAAWVAGTSTAEYQTEDWRGVSLNGLL